MSLNNNFNHNIYGLVKVFLNEYERLVLTRCIDGSKLYAIDFLRNCSTVLMNEQMRLIRNSVREKNDFVIKLKKNIPKNN